MDEKKGCEESLVEYRLTQIEKKLDDVTKLLLQTQAQELRLNTAERAIAELKSENADLKTELENKMKELDQKKSKNVDRWLSPLISALISGVVAFILVKVGLK